MKIIREGKTFTLTPEERRDAAQEYWLSCINEDIRCGLEEYSTSRKIDIDKIIAPTAEHVNKRLSNNDSYMEAYWATIEYAIYELNRGR